MNRHHAARTTSLLLPSLLLVAFRVVPLDAEEATSSQLRMDRVPWELAEPELRGGVWWDAPHIPIDHPYWWTLSPELSPEKLKQRLDKRAEAVEVEVVRERGKATGASVTEPQVRWIVEGRESPELFPAWSVFYSFASGRADRGPVDQVADELMGFGLEPGAVQVILEAARETVLRARELGREPGEAQLQLRDLYLQAEETIGKDRVAVLRSENDFALLSEHVGWSRDALRDLARRARRPWEAEAAVPAIHSIRGKLGEAQWGAFRRYLLEKVATRRAESVIIR
jgi:hypothetical protein